MASASGRLHEDRSHEPQQACTARADDGVADRVVCAGARGRGVQEGCRHKPDALIRSGLQRQQTPEGGVGDTRQPCRFTTGEEEAR